MSKSIIQSYDLHKKYHDGNEDINVLQGVDFSISPGETVAIVGPSGSGKSTLLHLLGGLDKPSDGRVLLHQVDWQILSEKNRCVRRNLYLGFVYQFHHLLPEFTALENVAMPWLLRKTSWLKACKEAKEMLKQVGLEHRLTHKPAQLSGGERQRVAIARALVHHPDCILADEPTGNLDDLTARNIIDLMLDLNRQYKTALVIVTHDNQIASRMNQIRTLQRGQLV
jgi:lipoprotein-releasing system ATP-binding protein